MFSIYKKQTSEYNRKEKNNFDKMSTIQTKYNQKIKVYIE